MDVNILCIGDVVGQPGRFALSQALPRLIQERAIDCVIVNAENASGGSGLTPQLYEKMLRYGANLITLGDHVYKRYEIIPVLERADNIVRPANLPSEAPGRGVAIFTTRRGPRVAVITVLGRLYMKPPPDCPFHAVDRLIAQLPSDVRIVVVEIHAEVTSEKVAMGWHLDGRASIVFGTHTHIPTADERVLPRGTAYITDLGMTGPYDSVLGRRKDRVLRHLLTGMPAPFDVAEGDFRLCGILATIDSNSGRAKHVERVRVDEPPPSANSSGALGE